MAVKQDMVEAEAQEAVGAVRGVAVGEEGGQEGGGGGGKASTQGGCMRGLAAGRTGHEAPAVLLVIPE